jgi:hypothetical protein
VLWQEIIPPQIVLEFVSGDGSEERDRTPWSGKFWIYETVIRPAYYGIYEVEKASVELYHLIGSHYELMTPNVHGQYEIPELQVALGIWQGSYQNMELPWLRWWNLQGKLLLSPEEKVIQAQQKAEKFAAKLRELGIDPETLD